MGPISVRPLELETEVAQAVEEVIQEQNWEDIHVEHEVANKGFSITKVGEPGLSPFSRSDITIYQRRDWNPPELDQIENISRWFPDKKLDVPLVELEIKNKPEISPSLRGFDANSTDSVLWGVIHVGSLKEPGLEILAPGSGFIYRVDNREELHNPEFVDFLLEHIEAQKTEDVYSDDQLREKISQFKPEVFHFNEVFSAYRDRRTKVLIILLSVFFEGYIEDLIGEAMEEARENDNAGKIYDSWDFKEGLDACRYFGLISENDYRIIDQIRDERNDYAHEHEKYHPDIQSTVSESGTLKEAIKLYEDIIGVEDSMLSN